MLFPLGTKQTSLSLLGCGSPCFLLFLLGTKRTSASLLGCSSHYFVLSPFGVFGGRVVGFAGVVLFLLVSRFWGWLVRVGRFACLPSFFGWGRSANLPPVCRWVRGVLPVSLECCWVFGVIWFTAPWLGGAVNRLGVISFSIYGFGLLYFFVILYLFG